MRAASRRGVLTVILLLPWLFAWVASPALAASDEFAADKPSPLRLMERGKDDETIVRFAGRVRLTGRFRVAWDVVGQTPRYLRVTFLPNDDSAMLLPHAAGSASVKELLLENNEAAAKLLLDRDTAASVLAKEVLALAGEATVTIADYRSVVACDQRQYLARLVSVTVSRGVAVASAENKRAAVRRPCFGQRKEPDQPRESPGGCCRRVAVTAACHNLRQTPLGSSESRCPPRASGR